MGVIRKSRGIVSRDSRRSFIICNRLWTDFSTLVSSAEPPIPLEGDSTTRIAITDCL